MFNSTFKKVAFGVAFSMAALSAHAQQITGAGASFPFPVYAKWATAYKAASNVAVNYQSVGSGAGIRQIVAKTVDFGASDAPMSPADLEKNGIMQFPAIMGGVVPIHNVAGVAAGQMRLTGTVLADIYAGKIKKWNDPAIVALNPGVNLPNADIIVVHRSDGSGTTALFTNYLSKVNADWKANVGEGTAVKWPTGQGGRGNEGVSNLVRQFANSIGYVEYAFAKINKLPHAQMQNRNGKFVQPDADTFKAAAAGANWNSVPGMGVVLTDQAGDAAWPITGASFILMHRVADKPEQTLEALKFFDWAFRNGEAMAAELEYVPMPAPVIAQIRKNWAEQIRTAAGQPIWK